MALYSDATNPRRFQISRELVLGKSERQYVLVFARMVLGKSKYEYEYESVLRVFALCSFLSPSIYLLRYTLGLETVWF